MSLLLIKELPSKIFGKRKRKIGIYKCSYCNRIVELKQDDAKINKSCGCARYKLSSDKQRIHGCSSKKNRDSLYQRWSGMKSRCYNKNNVAYPNYGGIGVIVCDEWKNDFLAFKKWAMKNGYNNNLHIDKDILSKKLNISPPIYSPETCQFVTSEINNQNRNRKKISKTGASNVYKRGSGFVGEKVINHKRFLTSVMPTIVDAQKELNRIMLPYS